MLLTTLLYCFYECENVLTKSNSRRIIPSHWLHTLPSSGTGSLYQNVKAVGQKLGEVSSVWLTSFHHASLGPGHVVSNNLHKAVLF